MPDAVRQVFWTACYYLFLLCFAAGVYAVNAVCFVLTFLIPQKQARRILRAVVHRLFRLYVGAMLASGALRANCDLLGRLRPGTGGRLIIANHPSMFDALVFLSRIPGLVCVFKSALKRSFTMARTASTLGYLSNDGGIVLIKDLATRLQAGEQVLLFPEGTRTSQEWINPFNAGYALAAMRARVPVQLVRIRTNSPILTKKQPFYKGGRFPVMFSFDPGPCIEPGTFQTVRQMNSFVEDWYRASLPDPAPLRRPFLPVGYSAEANAGGIRATFRVPDDPFYCHGHMPGNPLVPGYAQMAWVHEIVEACAGPLREIGFFRWKFLQPVLPGDPLEIVIGPPDARRDVAILRDGQRVTHGKLLVPGNGGSP